MSITLNIQNSGDGTLQLEELVTVLSECLKESGLKLPESDVREMADALYEEALGEVNKIQYFIKKNYCKWSNDVNGPT